MIHSVSKQQHAASSGLVIAESATISPLACIDASLKGSRIEIGDHVLIDAFVRIKPVGGMGDIIIGSNSYINSGTVIFSGNGVTIGSSVLVAPNCTFATTNHAYASREMLIREQGFLPSKGGIVIEDDVWIGANCTLLDGTFIKRGCIVGAGSLVRGELDAYGIYAGNPLRKIGERGVGVHTAVFHDKTDYHDDFSKYYPVLTQHKDYEYEVNRLVEALQGSGVPHNAKILSVGCGAAKHEQRLAAHYDEVHGVDIAPAMIAAARRENQMPNLHLFCGALADVKVSGFACAISLFNVVNCIESLSDVEAFFTQIADRLMPEGVLFFEAWNAYETNLKPPVTVTRDYTQGAMTLRRVVTPDLRDAKHLVLHYDVTGYDGATPVAFTSVHPLYLHRVDEFEAALLRAGFEAFEWFSALSEGMKPVAQGDRMLLCTARKKSVA